MGEDYDGAMLIIDMDNREFYISTCGYGITALGDNEISYISDEFLNSLSNGDYYDAFYTYATLCDEFVTAAVEGTVPAVGEEYYIDNEEYIPLDEYNDYYSDGYYTDSSSSFGILGIIVILVVSLIVGFLIAFIPMGRLKRQMRTVQMKAAASDYVKSGSIRITNSRDAFLYSHVTRVPKPKDNDNRHRGGHGGGMSFGGGVHMGSSGRMHGGGGGRF